jgi:F-type H+-transporting ATPase subunit delta
MLTSKASRRYATALLKSAEDEKSLDKVFSDIESMKKTFEDSKELVLILANPVVRKEKKLDILQELFKGRIHGLIWRFILLLSEKDRLELIPGIAFDFIRQYNVHSGIMEVQIISAFELEATQKKNIVSALEKNTGMQIKPTFQQNPELIGGLIVRIEDTVIDGSVKHKLEQLKHTLYKTAV